MIGKQILSYKIESLLGEGGMGNVYLASHVTLDRKVAVKSILPQLVKNEEIKSRFLNEAKTMSKLQHPNIVALYDYYTGEEGLFLFMEYVEGKELHDYLIDLGKPLDEDLSVAFMKQILSAFSHAHKKGIVHRDIKPSNILIGNDGEIKILDFGIAKILGEGGHNLTKTGTQVGTVYYMSPEQVEGKPVSHLSDIYSIGVTMYQLLTMVNPYKSCTTEFEIYKKITGEKLPDVTELNPTLSDSMVKIIHKATAKDPKDRFQSCQEFSDAFDTNFGTEEIPVSKTSNTQKKTPVSIPNQRTGNKKPLLIVLIVVLLAIIGGFVIFNSNKDESSSDSKNSNENNQSNKNRNSDSDLVEVINLQGKWTGDFNGNDIVIHINRQDGFDLFGYSELKNNHIEFIGNSTMNRSNVTLTLNEPRSSEFNGVFEIVLSNDHLVGTWKSYNGRLTRSFDLMPIDDSAFSKNEIFDKIENYYNDLNNQNFNAWDHYAPEIDKFLSHKNLSPNDINKFDQEKTDFLNAYVSIIDNRLEDFYYSGNKSIATFWVDFSCWRTRKEKWQHCKINIEVIFNDKGKIISYREISVNELTYTNSRY